MSSARFCGFRRNAICLCLPWAGAFQSGRMRALAPGPLLTTVSVMITPVLSLLWAEYDRLAQQSASDPAWDALQMSITRAFIRTQGELIDAQRATLHGGSSAAPVIRSIEACFDELAQLLVLRRHVASKIQEAYAIAVDLAARRRNR